MNRANKAIKYVEKIVNETIRDVIGINNLINEDFYEIISELDSNNKDRYIDYISIINFNSSGIALIYIIQTYRRKNEISYSLERFLYHKNLCFVSDYFDQFERNKNFFDLAEQGEILLMNFACNYFKSSQICYDKIIENIQSGKMANS
ncbi:hypothetical protein OSB94_20560, partial [Proteus vulgaris]|nr:hypothetical protein [Proteus vulgaris]